MSATHPTLRVEVPPGRTAERRYIAEVLLERFLGISCELQVSERADVRISSPHAASAREIVIDDSFFPTADADWLGAGTVPSGPVAVWTNPDGELPSASRLDRDLPVPFGRPLAGGGYLRLSDTRAELGVDIFGASFFFLTRYEEAVEGERDRHGRFPAPQATATRAGFLQRPIVNEYVEVLWALIRWLLPQAERKKRRYSVVLSHDVDSPTCLQKSAAWWLARSAANAAAGRRDRDPGLPTVLANCWTVEGRRRLDPCNTFDWLMDVSERVGVSSAFYFLTGPTSERPEGRYSIDDPWIRSLIRRISARGHEIGLHPTYDTWRDAALTRREFAKLLAVAEEEGIRQTRWGGRQHYLRWSNPHTWQNWEDAGLDYDSTLGFADFAGFRSGVCYEYPTFNLRTRTPLRLIERPLIVMDVSLFHYMSLTDDSAREQVVRLAAACRKFGGEMTLLWHNSSLRSAAEKNWYRETVEQICA